MILKIVFTNGEVFFKDSTMIEFVDEGVRMSPSSLMDSAYKTGTAVVPFRNVLYIDPIGSKEE